jgi:hypothetical protein
MESVVRLGRSLASSGWEKDAYGGTLYHGRSNQFVKRKSAVIRKLGNW